MPPSTRSTDAAGAGRIIQAVLSIAILLATLFTAFSPRLFSGEFGETILALMTPQVVSDSGAPAVEQTIRIGIVAGHWGNGEDVGAVCGNGATEVDLNYDIALFVRQELEKLNYTVDLLQEYDPRLSGYHAAALVSIHNDTCAEMGPEASGYKVAAAAGSRDPNLSARLVACLGSHYGSVTVLPFHPSSITRDMTEYHAFNEMDPATAAAIIETGFMYLDYSFLTEHTDLVAQGIVKGVVCFVENESIPPTPTP
jgi:N-acetylmuramoyl-L-alanine amidase